LASQPHPMLQLRPYRSSVQPQRPAAHPAVESQAGPAQPAKQAHAPSLVEQRPCPLQLTASSHSAPQAPAYRPAAHGSQRAPVWPGRQRQRPAATSYSPRAGPPQSAS
jgi:hypothetical protein